MVFWRFHPYRFQRIWHYDESSSSTRHCLLWNTGTNSHCRTAQPMLPCLPISHSRSQLVRQHRSRIRIEHSLQRETSNGLFSWKTFFAIYSLFDWFGCSTYQWPSELADAVSRWDKISRPPCDFLISDRKRFTLKELWDVSSRVSLHPANASIPWQFPSKPTCWIKSLVLWGKLWRFHSSLINNLSENNQQGWKSSRGGIQQIIFSKLKE